MAHTFIALICAPVPVGHRVEVLVLVESSGGFRKTETTRTVVSDLDTGVVYGEMEAFEAVTSIRAEPRPLPPAPRADLAVKTRVTGRVRACQVATMGFTDRWIQTTLVIE